MSSFSVIQLVAFFFVLLSATWVDSFSPSPIRLAKGYKQTCGASKSFLYIDHGSMSSASGEGRSARPLRQIQKKEEVVHSVSTLDEYETAVRDETERIVVVRFHAPYCKACQAIRVAYDRLVKQSNPDAVKFVDVSITEKNVLLGEQLRIPGVPFGQIYLPGIGLVEELLMSRRHMAKFRKVLGWYVNEQCEIPEEFYENPHEMDDNENLIL